MPKQQEHLQTIVHPLKPVFRSDSKILILGSFPSVKTREYGFFYGNPQNRFWPLLAALFKEEIGPEISARKAFLLRHHIALYDSIFQCDISGSSDASIKNVVPANLAPIFETAQIHHVLCNGATAFKYYQKYHEPKLRQKAIQLPSTSPANARYRLPDLIRAWSILLD